MDKKQKMLEKQLAAAYLKGRVDAQRELFALIKLLEDEICIIVTILTPLVATRQGESEW